MIELQQQIDDLNERLNKLNRAESPFFWDGVNVGIGAIPTAKLDVVNGFIRAKNGTNTPPTSGSGVEIAMVSSVGYVISYNRTGSAYLPLNINGSGITISNPVSALQLDITGAGSGATTNIEVGANATGSRYAYIDFHGDDTYTDYGLRLIRNNTGVNAISGLLHRGTGELQIVTVDAAAIKLYTNNTLRTIIDTNGIYPGNQASYYIGYNSANGLWTNGRLSVGSATAATRALSIFGDNEYFSWNNAAGTEKWVAGLETSVSGRWILYNSNTGNYVITTTGDNINMNSVGMGATALSNVRTYAHGADSTSSNYALFADDSAAAYIFYARNDGIVVIRSDLYSNGVKVLGQRITGWGAPTGVTTKTTFATSTVTTAQLAERVKGLIEDLKTHGLLGA